MVVIVDRLNIQIGPMVNLKALRAFTLRSKHLLLQHRTHICFKNCSERSFTPDIEGKNIKRAKERLPPVKVITRK